MPSEVNRNPVYVAREIFLKFQQTKAREMKKLNAELKKVKDDIQVYVQQMDNVESKLKYVITTLQEPFFEQNPTMGYRVLTNELCKAFVSGEYGISDMYGFEQLQAHPNAFDEEEPELLKINEELDPIHYDNLNFYTDDLNESFLFD